MNTSPLYKAIIIDYSQYREQIIKLRGWVWETNDHSHADQLYHGHYEDEFDVTAIHWGVFDNDKLIASCRMSVHNSFDEIPDRIHLLNQPHKSLLQPIASFNRLVVDDAFRKQGISELLDNVRMKKAIELKCKSVLIMTRGNRALKLLHDGFTELEYLDVSSNYHTDKLSTEATLPGIFYKAV